MAHDIRSTSAERFLPGTCVPAGSHPHVSFGTPKSTDSPVRQRDASLRQAYLDRALAAIPRLLGAIDRNPYRPTYGCLDREYWHYRTSSFPSEMYQEGALALAIVYSTRLPGNPYYRNRRIGQLATAAVRFAASSSRADGSCDDYYPFERALGAAVFSLSACAAAYPRLGHRDEAVLDWLRRRARWIMANDESGNLANHHALAALGLMRVARITGDESFRRGAKAKIDQVLDWQNDEGWFDEYGGADLGYQTVTIDCLAKIRQITADARLDGPLRRAVDFARAFLAPDGSCGGIYGSRGTAHFYPHGFELLAAEDASAAALADGFLARLAAGAEARLEDDRLHIHRVANLLEAYQDWLPTAPDELAAPATRRFPAAGLLSRRSADSHTVVSTARGGVFKHYNSTDGLTSDAGLILETTDGRTATSQMHDRTRPVDPPSTAADGSVASLTVAVPLCWARFETMTPGKQMLLHAGMCTLGRWCRTLVRRLLQRRLITGRRTSDIRLTRRFEWTTADGPGREPLRVTDTIELLDEHLQIKRMSFGTDHESAYIAATGGFEPGVLKPWTDLADHVAQLNRDRRVTITREL